MTPDVAAAAVAYLQAERHKIHTAGPVSWIAANTIDGAIRLLETAANPTPVSSSTGDDRG